MEKGHFKDVLSAVLTSAACMVIYMMNNGIRSNFGLIASAIGARTAVPAADIALAVASAQLLYGLSQPFFGILALRRSNSFVIGLGCLLMGAGLFLIPRSGSSAMLFLSLGVFVGLAAGALAFGMIMGAASPAIGRRYAAAASGIINGAGGLGGAVLAPSLQFMNDRGMFGAAMTALSAICVCMAAASVLIGRKERLAFAASDEPRTPPDSRAILRESFRSREFMHIALAFFTCGFFMGIINAYLYPQITGLGLSGSEAAMLFSFYGIAGMIGPVIAGFASGRVGARRVLASVYGLRVVFAAAFLLLPKTYPVIYAFCVGLGLVSGSTVTPTVLLITKFFGARKMPTLSGISFVFHQVGSFISTWLASVLIARYGGPAEIFGGYGIMWILAALLSAFASFLSFTVTKRAR